MNEDERRKPATVSTGDMAPKSEETDWSQIYDEQQAVAGQPPGGFLNNQLAKIGCGCALPALFMLGTCASLTSQNDYGGGGGAYALGYVSATVLGGMMLVWAPLFVFWLREQNKWVIGASFALFAGIFAILGFAKIGNSYQALKDDVGAISDVKFDVDGNPILTPELAKKGPMSKLMVDMATEQGAIRKEFETEIHKAGIDDMMLADKVAHNPSLVQNCGRIAAFKEVIERFRARNLALIESAPARIDALDVSYTTKAEMRRGAMDKMGFNKGTIGKQWDLQAQSLAPIQRACLVLSKRNWKAEGKAFAFYDGADMAAFNAAMRDLDKVNAEIGSVTRARIDDVKASQDRLKSQMRPQR